MTKRKMEMCKRRMKTESMKKMRRRRKMERMGRKKMKINNDDTMICSNIFVFISNK